MKISQDTYDHYWERGWTVVEGVFSAEEVDRVARTAVEVSDRELAHEASSFVADRGADGAVAPRKISHPFLKDPAFKAELDRQRKQITAEAFGVLSQSLTKAVETLVVLLDNTNDRLRRLAAKDIIDFIIRHKENEELEERIAALEQKLNE